MPWGRIRRGAFFQSFLFWREASESMPLPVLNDEQGTMHFAHVFLKASHNYRTNKNKEQGGFQGRKIVAIFLVIQFI